MIRELFLASCHRFFLKKHGESLENRYVYYIHELLIIIDVIFMDSDSMKTGEIDLDDKKIYSYSVAGADGFPISS